MAQGTRETETRATGREPARHELRKGERLTFRSATQHTITMPEVTIINPPPVTPGVFLDTLRTMGGGRTLLKLEDALREATKAAREAGAKSKINIELIITPNGNGVGETPLFKVTGKVKRTLPEIPDPASNYYADENDNLTRRNPHQDEMKLTALDGGKITKADLTQQPTGTTAK
jgi:hypothetical protein